jgi:hypothetical protein
MDRNNNQHDAPTTTTSNSTPSKTNHRRIQPPHPQISGTSISDDDDDETSNNTHYTISANLRVPNSFENEESRASYVSTILGEDPLSQQLREAIECSKCYHLSSGQVFQDRNFKLFCDDCVADVDSGGEEVEEGEADLGPKVCRNIAVEKVISELLEPHLQATPPKLKRVRTKTEPSDQAAENQTVPIDNDVNMRRASHMSVSDFNNSPPHRPSVVSPRTSTISEIPNSNQAPNSFSPKLSEPTKRPRCYTMPQNIVNAIEEYEKHKQELASRVVRWLQCSVCLESARPFIIEEMQPELAKQFRSMRKLKWKSKNQDFLVKNTNDVAPLLQVLQCTNGHLICGQCSAKLMADNNLRNVDTCCPFCRLEITEKSMIRNIAVEKILTLLPIECGTCLTKKPINEILTHETTECSEQTASCMYKILGCEFTGKRSTLQTHMQNNCLYHNRPAKLLQNEIKRYVNEKIEDYRDNEKTLKLFSKKLAFVDFQLNSQRTDEYVSRLYFKSGNISALGHTFCVKVWPAGIEPLYPTRNPERFLEYQICLKGLNQSVREDKHFYLEVSHLLLTPPVGGYDISGETHFDKLSSTRREGKRYRLNMDAHESNLILANDCITLRLFLFLN